MSKFFIIDIRESKPLPLGSQMFWQIITHWTGLVEGHQRNISPNYIEIGPLVSDKKIFKVFYIDILWKISPAPWRPGFWTSFFLLVAKPWSTFSQCHPSEIWLKLAQWFRRICQRLTEAGCWTLAYQNTSSWASTKKKFGQHLTWSQISLNPS